MCIISTGGLTLLIFWMKIILRYYYSSFFDVWNIAQSQKNIFCHYPWLQLQSHIITRLFLSLLYYRLLDKRRDVWFFIYSSKIKVLFQPSYLLKFYSNRNIYGKLIKLVKYLFLEINLHLKRYHNELGNWVKALYGVWVVSINI